MKALGGLLLLFVAGCSGGIQSHMPLEDGNTWVYVVRLDADEAPVNLTVEGEAPVGSEKGWWLRSGMGDSRLAWEGNVLVAAELLDTVYSPPVPLLAPVERTWKGVVTTLGLSTAATATLTRERDDLVIAGKNHETIKTVLTLESAGETVQLTTWFFPGMGILRQEQRRGPALTRDRYIEFVSGPTKAAR